MRFALRIIPLCLVSSILTIWITGTALADCTAFAEPSGEARIASNGKTYAAFKVTGKPCKENGCRGYVDFYIHYIAYMPDRLVQTQTSYHDGSAAWKSDSGEPDRASQDGYENFCHDKVCEVQHVEVVSVSCYDGY